MVRYLEQCLSISRKKVLFGIALIYAVAFLIVQYRYGWSFFSYLKAIGLHSGPMIKVGHDNVPLPDLVLRDFVNGNASAGLVHRTLDIHFEDPVLGHTGNVTGHHEHGITSFKDMTNHIAIGGGITSKKLVQVNRGNMKVKFQFFSILLPSFCRTASVDYHYHFYLAYDMSDPVFSDQNHLVAFNDVFYEVCKSLCPKNLKTSLHFVQCSHQGKPAWAQNDAMIEAYLDGMEYFYRVNDDSILESTGWAEAFVNTLVKYDPSNIGVVGPNHLGGNQLILTYDFVHRTHLEMFGFYYPRVFTDWYADDWVTKVYMPGRMTKLSKIHLKHTMTLGQRYKNDFSIYPKLESQLKTDKMTLSRYIKYRNLGHVQPNTKKVISMSLYGNNPRYTMGAIRNAQIIPVFFPGWTLRVYVVNPNSEISGRKWIVPERIIGRLKLLGAQIAYVDPTHVDLNPKWWSFLVADDPTVSYFLVRNADSRLSDRDATAVHDWLESSEGQSTVFHCIRDHQEHKSMAIVDGLWGGRSEPLQQILTPGMHFRIQAFISNHSTNADTSKEAEPDDFLSEIIWSLVQDSAFCHDSVSCKEWPNSYSFPEVMKDPQLYLGQRFDEHQQLADSSSSSVSTECDGKGKWTPEKLPASVTPLSNKTILSSQQKGPSATR